MIEMKGIRGISVWANGVIKMIAEGMTEIDEGTLITSGKTEIVVEDVSAIRRISVESVKDAWIVANALFPTDYAKDEASSKNAGYPIYRSTAEDCYYDYICDLNCRLEINLKTNQSISIWITSSSVEAKAT